MTVKKNVLTFILILLFVVSFSYAEGKYRWFKGQTHCHTVNSDGDELPRRVVRWYRDHNYNFLVITDHNYVTEINYLDTDKNDDFILIRGEEVTDRFEKKQVHLNGIDIKRSAKPRHGKTVIETLQNNIDAIREAGGIAQINHPLYKWSFTDKEMTALENVKLFEVYNANLDCNNYGGGGEPGMEEIWDRMLSKGKVMYGVTVDDTHDYEGEFRLERYVPGKAWIMVRAVDLTAEHIVEALEKGDFYGTVGITLTDITITGKEYRIAIKQKYDMKYTTLFIGKDGKILKKAFGLNPVYRFKGDELYVRAKVMSSGGEFAVTQPVFTGKTTHSRKR